MWNTGATTPAIVVSTAGTYSATVTDAKGCETVASIIIETQNVTCGNSGDKVMICHNGNMICIASNAVQAHLNHGDNLGSCPATTFTRTITKTVEQESSKAVIYPKPVTGKRITTVVQEEITFEVNMYPNPVTDKLNIRLTNLHTAATIQLYNSFGAIILVKKLTNSTTTVSMKSLPSGIYFVQVGDGKNILQKKIIKE